MLARQRHQRRVRARPGVRGTYVVSETIGRARCFWAGGSTRAAQKKPMKRLLETRVYEHAPGIKQARLRAAWPPAAATPTPDQSKATPRHLISGKWDRFSGGMERWFVRSGSMFSAVFRGKVWVVQFDADLGAVSVLSTPLIEVFVWICWGLWGLVYKIRRWLGSHSLLSSYLHSFCVKID